MRNIKLTIEYDGTPYNGWQIQSNSSKTIQGIIEGALKKICKTKTRCIGSGRTDTGVHATGQVANFKTNTTLSSEELLKALNANVPKDISILKVEEVKDNFHAQYSVKSKTYRYTILNRTAKSALYRNYSLHTAHKLNVTAMKREAKDLVGRHDFKSFQATDSKRKRKSTIRTIKKFDIKRKGDFITIDIEANGFLYKMVRNIVGTLIAVGRGKLPKGSVAKILRAKDRNLASDTAKSHGLCLFEVKY